MAKPVITVKQGDDFSLDLTVKDTNNDIAIAAKTVLDVAILAYTTAFEAVPQVSLTVSNALAAQEAAQTAYDEAIVLDITGWTIAAHLGWCGKFVSAFSVVVTDALTGQFAISVAKEVTQTWKIKTYEADIEFNAALFGRQSSQTFLVKVERGVTNVI